jgi:hypothetical protein
MDEGWIHRKTSPVSLSAGVAIATVELNLTPAKRGKK